MNFFRLILKQLGQEKTRNTKKNSSTTKKEKKEEYIRKTGGGRKKNVDKYPQLRTNFDKIYNKYKAGSPMQENAIWIDESLTKFALEVSLLGIECTPYICKQLLKEKKLW